ncbi:MAG TPA: ABC transporter permease [Candidatus Limnocylindrales bacterium]|nr:ABC transporter permease [Candidatus Limnocylindrales bacterium]
MSIPSSKAVASGRPGDPRPSLLGLVRAGLDDLLTRRRLIGFLVGADLKRTHADTIIGQLWWVVDPLLQMVVYAVLVGVVFQRSTPDFPLFLFAAILPWKWFSTTLSDATISVTNRSSLIRQVPFPKLVLPAAATLAGTVSFAIGLVALGAVYLFYLHRLSPWLLTLPLVALVQLVFTFSLAVLFAALNAFYRDVQNVLRHALRLWFYVSPTLYSLEQLEDHGEIGRVLALNPMAPILTSYRSIIWGHEGAATRAPEWLGLGAVVVLSLVLLAVALAVFKRVEPGFARIL